ncbi:histone-lysine N-trimethyltransferase SMYD5-like isoform X2 [Watersipora subatra]|uniref:histone-lysine N-trimethyltransferase SMYD5-like isoform X2 n=1 Tax=Watersipora subatra TaxID=2589382 RepID=UPI00355C4407
MSFILNFNGRGLFTTEYVRAGDVLFEEEPLVACQFSWNACCHFDACDYCMRSLETAEQNARRLSKQESLVLPHPECCETQLLQHVVCEGCGTRYCCAECRSTAFTKYHRSICDGSKKELESHPLRVLENTWKDMHFPPETTSIGLFVKLFAMLQQADKKDVLLAKLEKFCSKSKEEDTNHVHKLLGPQFVENLEVLREMLLQLFGELVPDWLTCDGFRSLFAMVGRNGQGIGTSSLEVWERNCNELDLPKALKDQLDEFISMMREEIRVADSTYIDEDGIEQYCDNVHPFLDCEGSGLYSMQSAINHSCVPNAEVNFPYNNFVCRVVATQDILPDQEVFISYLDDCMLGSSRHSRQKNLKENYLFVCGCEKCMAQANDPDVTSEEDSDLDSDEYIEEDSMS